MSSKSKESKESKGPEPWCVADHREAAQQGEFERFTFISGRATVAERAGVAMATEVMVATTERVGIFGISQCCVGYGRGSYRSGGYGYGGYGRGKGTALLIASGCLAGRGRGRGKGWEEKASKCRSAFWRPGKRERQGQGQEESGSGTSS